MSGGRVDSRAKPALSCSCCGDQVHASWDHLVIGEFGEFWACVQSDELRERYLGKRKR